MINRLSFAQLFLFLFVAPTAFGQLNPSSALLLNQESEEAARQSGIDSGRYTVRPNSNKSSLDKETKGVTGASQKQKSNLDIADPRSSATNGAGPLKAMNESKTDLSANADRSGLKDQLLEELLLKLKKSEIELENLSNSKNHLDQNLDDIQFERRAHLLEIDVAPAFVYTDSNSDYSFRRYHTSGSALSIGTNVWLTPQFAIHGDYLGTLNGSVNDSSSSNRESSVQQIWLNLGIRNRHFFGSSSTAPSMIFGLDYYEYQFQVPTDANFRERLQSTGLTLSFSGDIPVNARRAWTIGASITPKIIHTESSTGVEFQSGGAADANSIGVMLGGRYQFDSSHGIFFNLCQIVERDLFSGDSSKEDPLTSANATGVSVTQSFTIFRIGYTWGNR